MGDVSSFLKNPASFDAESFTFFMLKDAHLIEALHFTFFLSKRKNVLHWQAITFAKYSWDAYFAKCNLSEGLKVPLVQIRYTKFLLSRSTTAQEKRIHPQKSAANTTGHQHNTRKYWQNFLLHNYGKRCVVVSVLVSTSFILVLKRLPF